MGYAHSCRYYYNVNWSIKNTRRTADYSRGNAILNVTIVMPVIIDVINVAAAVNCRVAAKRPSSTD